MTMALAIILLLLGGFVFTQGGKGVGPTLAGIGGVILLIKIFAGG